MKKILPIFLSMLLLLSGCVKSPESPESNSGTSPPETRDPVRLLDHKLRQAQALWDFNTDHDRAIRIEDISYYKTDLKMSTPDEYKDQIRSLYSERVYLSLFSHLFSKKAPAFVEKNDAIYFDPNFKPIERLNWDVSKAHIDIQSKDRLVFSLPCTSKDHADELLEGKIVLVLEDHQWKFDQSVFYQTGVAKSNYILNPDLNMSFPDKDEMIRRAGDPNNGWRLEQPIENYLIETDEKIYTLCLDDEFKKYLALNVYSIENEALHLEDKIFISINDEEVFYPERDEKGIISPNYSHLVQKEKNDSLAAYYHIPFVETDRIADHFLDFTTSHRISDDMALFVLEGNEFYSVIPKYYGTKIIASRLDTSRSENTIADRFYADEAPISVVANISDIRPNTRIEILYQHEHITFEPFISLEDGKPQEVDRITIINLEKNK